MMAKFISTFLIAFFSVYTLFAQSSPKVQKNKANTNGKLYVDLGLPSGNLWATKNIGAATIKDYGFVYAWAETEPCYSVNNYKYYEEVIKQDEHGWDYRVNGYTKYVQQDDAYRYGFDHKFYDNKTILDPDDDVAHIVMGGDWRMPTEDDFKELLDNCKHIWTTYNGVKGAKFTAKNGKWVFFPAAGCQIDFGYTFKDFAGWYWTNTLEVKENPISFYIEKEKFTIASGTRTSGYSVRAVCHHSKK